MRSDITLQRLRAEDPNAEVVAGWTFSAWGHLHPGLTLEQAIERTKAKCGQAGVPSIFVAIQNETPVGTASLIADDMSIRRELTPWLASVFVVPEWRGQGIASALHEHTPRTYPLACLRICRTRMAGAGHCLCLGTPSGSRSNCGWL